MHLDCIDHGQKGSKSGHGKTTLNGKSITLSRAVFFKFHGYLPEVVRHTCDNPRCMNPDHLIAGTQSDNIRDAIARGRFKSNLPDWRKITLEQEQAIREDARPQREIALDYGINQSQVSRIKRRPHRAS